VFEAHRGGNGGAILSCSTYLRRTREVYDRGGGRYGGRNLIKRPSTRVEHLTGRGKKGSSKVEQLTLTKKNRNPPSRSCCGVDLGPAWRWLLCLRKLAAQKEKGLRHGKSQSKCHDGRRERALAAICRAIMGETGRGG